MASDKALPRKLEEDLNNAKFYKPSGGHVESGAQRIAKVFDDSKERAMYDEILGPMLGSNKALPATKAPSTSTGDFNTTIIARLKHVETEAKDARQKLAEQIMANEKLREENALLKSMVSGPTGAVEEVAKLKHQNSQLHSKIREMEAFLGDYGLVWVGNKSNTYEEDVAEEAENAANEASGVKAPAHTVSYSDFNFHIDELNAVIYSEPAQIVIEGSNQRKARLVQSSELLENVRIVYYRNGLMIKRGPFRQCGSPGYKTFVKDIMDGYFPSEFQGEYPEGVVFDLKDQRHVDFVEGKTDSYAENSQMSRAQLLNRLPKTVIHKGEVVGMRADIENLLGGKGSEHSSSSNLQVAPKPKIVIETSAGIADISHHESMGEMVQIQVKWVDQSTFIAKLYEHNTVGDLKAFIVQHFQGSVPSKSNLVEAQADQKGTGGEGKSQDKNSSMSTMTYAPTGEDCISLVGALGFDFELRSAYPPRALGLHLSLKEAGLSPNGTVHARKLEY